MAPLMAIVATSTAIPVEAGTRDGVGLLLEEDVVLDCFEKSARNRGVKKIDIVPKINNDQCMSMYFSRRGSVCHETPNKL